MEFEVNGMGAMKALLVISHHRLAADLKQKLYVGKIGGDDR